MNNRILYFITILCLAAFVFLFTSCDDNDLDEGAYGKSDLSGSITLPAGSQNVQTSLVFVFEDNPGDATETNLVSTLATVELLSGSGNFSFNLDRDITYYVSVFQDIDENGLYSSSPVVEPYAYFKTDTDTSPLGILLESSGVNDIDLTLVDTEAPPDWFQYAGRDFPISLGGDIDAVTSSVTADGPIYIMLFDENPLDANAVNEMDAMKTITLDQLPGTFTFDNLQANQDFYIVAFWEIEVFPGDLDGRYVWGTDVVGVWDNRADLIPTVINSATSRDDLYIDLVQSDENSDQSSYVEFLIPETVN
jgi:hypothetical protein